MEALLPVAHVLGRFLTMFSLAYLAPIAAALVANDGMAIEFAFAMALTLALGVPLLLGTRRTFRELKVRDGFLLVTLTWTLMATIASVPFLLVWPDLGFTRAFFEAISALTTTGATVLANLDHAPPSVNLWRHELQWLGGMGIIVLAVAVLPMLGVGGMQLFRAEMPGPMKEGRLTARMADTAKVLWLIYVGLTVACFIALSLAGMGAFDALCHAFSAVSLGGFSTRDASIGAFDSPAIEAVIAFFMVVGAVNFATHYLAWSGGPDPRRYLRDPEARTLGWVLLLSVAGAAVYLHAAGTYPDFLTALRHAGFNVLSVATTTGFASVDYANWPVFVTFAMLFLSGVTASSGSTGGGIKMMRTLVLYKQATRELHRLLHPNMADLVKLGDVPVSNKIAFSVLGFIFLYFMTLATMNLLLLATGMDFVTAFSAVVGCINNLGPGLGAVGPASNYSGLGDFQLWILAATMLLGRLEILSVLVVFTAAFWRK